MEREFVSRQLEKKDDQEPMAPPSEAVVSYKCQICQREMKQKYDPWKGINMLDYVFCPDCREKLRILISA